jgi:hypothetical protein
MVKESTPILDLINDTSREVIALKDFPLPRTLVEKALIAYPFASKSTAAVRACIYELYDLTRNDPQYQIKQNDDKKEEQERFAGEDIHFEGLGLDKSLYLTLLYKFYSNKLTEVSYKTDLNFREKVNVIRKIKDNIYQLKQGKLVIYNL